MRELLNQFIPEKYLQAVLPILKQKYAITIGIFVVWVAFIDSNSLIERAGATADLNELHETKLYYKEKVERDARLLNELKRNNHVLERYAREKYLMKKSNEDIFLIVEE